jgi:hypothetical protein
MTTPTQLDQRDIGALIGLLAVLGAGALTGDLPLDQGLRLRRRLVGVGLLSPDKPYADFADALAALTQRLRLLERPSEAAGEPRQVVENMVAFGEPQAAQAFVDQLRTQGRDVDGPVHESSYRRWTVVVRSPRLDDDSFAVVGPDAAAARALGGWHLGAF